MEKASCCGFKENLAPTLFSTPTLLSHKRNIYREKEDRLNNVSSLLNYFVLWAPGQNQWFSESGVLKMRFNNICLSESNFVTLVNEYLRMSWKCANYVHVVIQPWKGRSTIDKDRRRIKAGVARSESSNQIAEKIIDLKTATTMFTINSLFYAF